MQQSYTIAARDLNQTTYTSNTNILYTCLVFSVQVRAHIGGKYSYISQLQLEFAISKLSFSFILETIPHLSLCQCIGPVPNFSSISTTLCPSSPFFLSLVE